MEQKKKERNRTIRSEQNKRIQKYRVLFFVQRQLTTGFGIHMWAMIVFHMEPIPVVWSWS